MTILDAYIRRDEGQENVIGTLLGSCSDGNVIDVTDCFVDRHSLTGEVSGCNSVGWDGSGMMIMHVPSRLGLPHCTTLVYFAMSRDCCK